MYIGKKQLTKEQNIDTKDEDNTLKVEIVSNWSLLEILSDRKKVLKIMISLLVFVFTIFIGLAFVTISIKRIYPYNDIKVNAFGATTMQNEDVEHNLLAVQYISKRSPGRTFNAKRKYMTISDKSWL